LAFPTHRELVQIPEAQLAAVEQESPVARRGATQCPLVQSTVLEKKEEEAHWALSSQAPPAATPATQVEVLEQTKPAPHIGELTIAGGAGQRAGSPQACTQLEPEKAAKVTQTGSALWARQLIIATVHGQTAVPLVMQAIILLVQTLAHSGTSFPMQLAPEAPHVTVIHGPACRSAREGNPLEVRKASK